MGSSAYSSGDSCEIRDKNLRTIRQREMSNEGLGLFNFSVFKSTLGWGEGGRSTEKPPPSCKVHVLSHAFLSLRVQLSPILMELKPNKSSFYAFSPPSPTPCLLSPVQTCHSSQAHSCEMIDQWDSPVPSILDSFPFISFPCTHPTKSQPWMN